MFRSESEPLHRFGSALAAGDFEAAGLDWEKHVEINERYVRPTEVSELQGDFTKARQIVGWEPK